MTERKKGSFCVVTIKEYITCPSIYGLWLITPLVSLNLCFRCRQDANIQSQSDKLLTNTKSLEFLLVSICLYCQMGCSVWTFCAVRRVWRYQRGNQNPYIEEEQTTQWPKEKVQKYKQRPTKHTHKTKERVTRTRIQSLPYNKNKIKPDIRNLSANAFTILLLNDSLYDSISSQEEIKLYFND